MMKNMRQMRVHNAYASAMGVATMMMMMMIKIMMMMLILLRRKS